MKPDNRCIEVGISYMLMIDGATDGKLKAYKTDPAVGDQDISANRFASWFQGLDQVGQYRFILGWQVFSYAKNWLDLLQATCHDD